MVTLQRNNSHYETSIFGNLKTLEIFRLGEEYKEFKHWLKFLWKEFSLISFFYFFNYNRWLRHKSAQQCYCNPSLSVRCKQLSDETHHGIFEKLIFCVILPEQKFTFTSHCGLDLNYELMIFQTPLCGKRTQC